MRTLVDLVARTLDDPIDAILARSIFGSEEPRSISKLIGNFVLERMQRHVEDCWLFAQSVGAVFGVRLDDGSRAILKVHGPGDSLARLAAAYKVQALLKKRGFPCPRVLRAPEPWANVIVAAQEYSADGDFLDAHDPIVRRAMAETLAALIEKAKLLKHTRGLEPHLPTGYRLWPDPHSALFDFEATARGAEWIDDVAKRARAVLAKSEPRTVLGHADWSAKNMRIADGEVSVVYDWDSAAVDDEMTFLANAAMHFTYNEHAHDKRPSQDESRQFVRDYIRVRGRPLTDEQTERLSAAAAYTVAYTARCEHARDPKGDAIAGSFRERLEHASRLDYLRP